MMVRVLTYHKGLEAIEPEIVNAINDGNQVLVNSACFSPPAFSPSAPATPKGEAEGIAEWAEALSQLHGLGWRRVGLDVLFRRANA